MKIRCGFVTNSSTTCYIFWGVRIYDLTEEQINIVKNKFTTKCDRKDIEYNTHNLYEILEFLVTPPLKFYDTKEDGVLIGTEVSKTPEDLTLRQFKLQISRNIEEQLGISNLKIEYLEHVEEQK